MSLFDTIKSKIPPETVLCTPKKRHLFRINYEGDKIVFFKDAKKKPFSKTPKICWDGIPNFLRGKNWVRIGPKFGVAPKNSLQDYIDEFWSHGKTHSSEASHVTSVLESLGIVEIDRGRPLMVRLVVDTT